MARKKRMMKHHSAHHSKELKHKSFWLSLLLVFLVSFVVILSLSSQQSLTGHATVQPIAFAKSGSSILSEVNIGHIKTATTFVKEDVNRGKIIFKEDPQILFNGQSLSEVAISVEGVVPSRIDLTLKIKYEDLAAKGIKANEVKLYLNNKEVATKLTEHEGAYYYYSASINDVGDVVIGKKTAQRVVEKLSNQIVPVVEQVTEPAAEPSAQQPSAYPAENIAGRSFWQKFLDLFR